MRVWLPDRPGALGELASRLGAGGAEIIAIDILERDGTRAVDELTLELGETGGVDDLLAAVAGLDGFDVEDLRPLVSRLPFPGGDALEAAAGLLGCNSPEALFAALTHSACSVFSGEWAAVLDPTGSVTVPALLGTAGDVPSPAWLAAFVGGAQAIASMTEAAQPGPRDVAWAPLEDAALVAVVGRDGPPFRSRERRELAQLCRITDHRWRELHVRAGLLAHPSTGKAGRPAADPGRIEHPA